jgi:small conductance mechanosensitive channel
MQLDPNEAFGALQSGFGALWALAISYSFSVVGAIVLMIVGFIAANMIQRAVQGGLNRVPSFDRTLSQFFGMIARYVVLAIVFVMVLGQFGVQTASVIAAIGAIGLAVGLALQGTLQNIAAGIMLLVLRPFRVGEYVEIDNVRGTVEDVGLFATRLRTPDGIFILAPNSTLWNTPVYNFTRNGRRRNDITIGIGYGDDIALAQQAMLDLAKADPRVLNEPEPTSFVNELADSAVTVTLRYWTGDQDFLTVRQHLTKSAKLAFDEKGISIPFPQQEVVFKNAGPVVQ